MARELNKRHIGSRFIVEHCDGAMESFEDALVSVTPHKRKNSVKRSIILLIERLAEGSQMSQENFPQEGNLPKGAGKFNAFKKVPIRAYCWLSKKHPNTYFISHYTYKDKQKLAKQDTDRVHANWKIKED